VTVSPLASEPGEGAEVASEPAGVALGADAEAERAASQRLWVPVAHEFAMNRARAFHDEVAKLREAYVIPDVLVTFTMPVVAEQEGTCVIPSLFFGDVDHIPDMIVSNLRQMARSPHWEALACEAAMKVAEFVAEMAAAEAAKEMAAPAPPAGEG
jgi:hypothetical protein